jgi:hypothetical protein
MTMHRDRWPTQELDENGDPVPPGRGQRCAYHSDQLHDHEDRIRVLERAQWRIAGAVGAIVGALSLAGSLIGSFISK